MLKGQLLVSEQTVSRDHTERMLQQFGAEIASGRN